MLNATPVVAGAETVPGKPKTRPAKTSAGAKASAGLAAGRDHAADPATVDPGIHCYHDLRDEVFQDIVAPDIVSELRSIVVWRRRWRSIGNYCEGFAQIIIGVAGMLSFAAGFFNNQLLSFAAGCASTLCLVMMRFSSYAENESVERNTILSRILTRVGIAPMPAITAAAPDEDKQSVLLAKSLIDSDEEAMRIARSPSQVGFDEAEAGAVEAGAANGAVNGGTHRRYASSRMSPQHARPQPSAATLVVPRDENFPRPPPGPAGLPKT